MDHKRPQVHAWFAAALLADPILTQRGARKALGRGGSEAGEASCLNCSLRREPPKLSNTDVLGERALALPKPPWAVVHHRHHRHHHGSVMPLEHRLPISTGVCAGCCGLRWHQPVTSTVPGTSKEASQPGPLFTSMYGSVAGGMALDIGGGTHRVFSLDCFKWHCAHTSAEDMLDLLVTLVYSVGWTLAYESR